MSESIKVLFLKIYQPSAHYRIPFTYQRRHTYPIPPYSTVIGLLCNTFGIKNETGTGKPSNSAFQKLEGIKIAICGNFESKVTQYVWFRNFSTEKHIERFGYPENRSLWGIVEHPGGQIPVSVDVLFDVRLKIYIYHEDEVFLTEIENKLKNPCSNSIIHLGRAEDLVVFDKIEKRELEVSRIGGNFNHFFWIPELYFAFIPSSVNLYNEAHKLSELDGIAYRIPSFYEIQSGERIFKLIHVKLNEGNIYGIRWLFDKRESLPVFLANLS